ncbi:MAG: MmgE/PrpD family protein [Pusillimonas sp.]
MSTEQLCETLADWIASTRFEDLGDEVIAKTISHIKDYIGVTIGGAVVESGVVARSVVRPWAHGECVVAGTDMRTSAPFAAWLNGISAHTLELDDVHRGSILHAGVAVIPAAMAVAETHGATTRDLILAVALGYEVMIRLGDAQLGKSNRKGFHTTGTCGSIAAAVAVAKIYELERKEIVSTIGLGASQSAGLLTFRTNGAWNKRLHAGHAAMSGVIAAALAREKYYGPSESLGGPDGWLQAYAYENEYEPQRMTDRLGTHWLLLENSIKIHSCCRFAAPIVDATLAAVEKEDIQPEDVESVLVRMARYPLTRSLTEPKERKYRPLSVVDAQFSAPYAVAVALVKRRAFLDEYSESAIRDPALLDVAARVTWEVDPQAEKVWPHHYPCEVVITRKGGSSLVSRIEWPKGDPENPLTQKELNAKFYLLASPVLGHQKTEQVLTVLDDLDSHEVLVRDVAALFSVQ